MRRHLEKGKFSQKIFPDLSVRYDFFRLLRDRACECVVTWVRIIPRRAAS